ncbi:MAG: sodium ion-translocating decarboxylase subunit beta [Clostridia bacterium]|nr:sodium ion-translocating decarboxylase subunit beta [Clostridia bacterium]
MIELLKELFSGVLYFGTPGGLRTLVMFAISGVLIYLAIAKDYEPALLLPIGFGAILVNLPPTIDGIAAVLGAEESPGFLRVLFDAGIATELFPILIFIAIGAMIDFTPLLKNPFMIFFGAAAQFGIFATFLLTLILLPYMGIVGEEALKLAAAVGIIGAADGPTTIYVANHFNLRDYMGPISVAAYSYMSLVPIIQPPVIRALTTRKERLIRMDYTEERVSPLIKVLFPIIITIIAGVIVPMSVPLVGSLMFGNLIRECGVLEKLSKAAQNELSSLVTILLGITIGSTMVADKFIQWNTALIMLLGLLAFIFDTAGGVLFAKLLNVFLKKKINPMIGAAGISAFPMSARVVQRMAKAEDPTNFILMPAVSANVAGQLGSIVAGGLVISLISMLVR